MKLLAYCVMSNHFHVFVYIGRPEPLSDAEIVRRISALYSDVRFEQVMKKWNELAKSRVSAIQFSSADCAIRALSCRSAS